MRIVLACHNIIREKTNPKGPNYQRIEPALSRSAWKITEGWADMILCGDFDTATAKDGKSKTAKTKAYGGNQRILLTGAHAVYDAKNRHGLPAEIVLGPTPSQAYQAFTAAFPHHKNGTTAKE